VDFLEKPRDMQTNPIVFVLGIDCEPDLFEPQSSNPAEWLGIKETFNLMKHFRHRAMRRLGNAVNFVWFWRCDPQIAHYFGSAHWALSHFRALIDEALSYGDVLGVHPHTWRFDEETKRGIFDWRDSRLIEATVLTSVDAYRTVFGTPPTALSMGNEYFDKSLFALIADCGIGYDLSVAPGLGPRVIVSSDDSLAFGLVQDTRQFPQLPCWISCGNRDDSSKGIWALPQTTGLGDREDAYVAHGWLRRYLNPGRAERLEDLHMCNIGMEPALFRAVLADGLKRTNYRYMAMRIRADAGVTDILRANAEINLDYLIEHKWADRFRFVTPADAVELVKKG
jgi:hypothetical protein